MTAKYHGSIRPWPGGATCDGQRSFRLRIGEQTRSDARFLQLMQRRFFTQSQGREGDWHDRSQARWAAPSAKEPYRTRAHDDVVHPQPAPEDRLAPKNTFWSMRKGGLLRSQRPQRGSLRATPRVFTTLSARQGNRRTVNTDICSTPAHPPRPAKPAADHTKAVTTAWTSIAGFCTRVMRVGVN